MRNEDVMQVIAVRRMVVLAMWLMAIPLVAESSESPDESGKTQQRTKPTAAFVDADRSALGALLETRLLSTDVARWLERTEIDQVLRERELDSLMTPAGTAERSSVGKLLKADLLVVLRQRTQPKPHVSVVVCQTKTGLRLTVESRPLTDKVEADAEALERLVLDGLRRHVEALQEVCAVPPFVSHDLTRQEDHLKAAFAKLVEQTLRSTPGLLLVEFEEAQAIAKELRLATQTVRRPLPLYVLGEYRHSSQDEARTLRVGLKVVRGEKELAQTEKSDLSSPAAVRFVDSATANLLRKSIGKQPQPSDPDTEAEQLAQRAKVFLNVGDWDEALSLIEASLLLKPKQSDVHHDAIVALAELTIRYWRYGQNTDPGLGLSYYHRGLEHVEIFLGLVDNLDRYQPTSSGAHFLFSFRGSAGGFFNQPNRPADLQRLADETIRYQRDFLLKETRRRVRAQLDWKLSQFLFLWALEGLSEKEKLPLILKTLAELQHSPGAKVRTRIFATHGYTIHILDTPEGREFLKQLAGFENQETKVAAEALQRELAAYVVAKNSAATPQPRGNDANDQRLVEFRRIEVVARSHEGVPLPAPNLEGVIPAGKGLDVAWARGAIYVMKTKGVWQQLGVLPVNTQLTHVGFDGKFVWASGNGQKAPVLCVLDPVSERVWPITAAEGLLVEKGDQRTQFSHRLAVAALDPGRALLVGSFGRTWIGTAQFSETQGFSMKLFHEAREVANPENKQQGQSTTVAFTPTFVFPLRGPVDSQERSPFRVLVGRSTTNIPQVEVGYHPLIVNPDDETVAVHPERLWGELPVKDLTFHEGNVYVCRPSPPKYATLDLFQIRFPGMTQEVVLSDVREGRIIVAKDRVHFAGYDWWDQSLPDGSARRLHDLVPWRYFPHWGASQKHLPAGVRLRNLEPKEAELRFAGLSQHYGMLAVTSNQQRGIEHFQVIPAADDVQKTK